MVKQLTLRFIVTSGCLLFTFFVFMGFYRFYSDITSLQADLAMANAGLFAGSNEFQALLGTAYDVFKMKLSGVYLPWYLYINDFITILPPQQIFPFEKVPASEWYLRELGISGEGVGFMWGVISQSIIGYDWFELIVRGSVLGYLLARIHKWYAERQTDFLVNMFYVYLCLRIYYTFRDTTFSILASIVWEIIPFYLIIKIADAFGTEFNKRLPRKLNCQ